MPPVAGKARGSNIFSSTSSRRSLARRSRPPNPPNTRAFDTARRMRTPKSAGGDGRAAADIILCMRRYRSSSRRQAGQASRCEAILACASGPRLSGKAPSRYPGKKRMTRPQVIFSISTLQAGDRQKSRMGYRFARHQHRFKNFAQRPASTQNARLHRTHRNVQDLGHLFVGESFQITQDDRRSKDRRHFCQCPLNHLLNFVAGEFLEWGYPGAFKLSRAVDLLLLDGSLESQMTPETAPVIQTLAHRDAIQPGLQGTAVTKRANAPECLQKHLLRHVGSIVRIAQYPGYDRVDRGVIVGHEPVESRFGAAAQLRHDLGFVLRPG